MNVRQEVGYRMQQTTAAWTRTNVISENVQLHPIAVLAGKPQSTRQWFKNLNKFFCEKETMHEAVGYP